MATREKGNVGGDVVLSNFNPIVDVESRNYTNETDDVQVFPPGYPWSFDDEDATPILVADLANTEGINYQELRVEPDEAVKIAILVARHPIALNKDALPTVDIDDDEIVEATYVTKLETLGFVCRSEPVVTEEQTT
jgi:hypothetical protein